MVGRRLVTIFLSFFGAKNSTPDPPARKSGSWNVKGGTSCSQREFRSPVVWSRWFCNKSFFLKKHLAENIHDATKMVPNQPKKSLKHLGSCESFILPSWQGVLFEGPFLKDLTSTPPCTSENLKLDMELQKTFCAALAMQFFERCKF